MQRKLSGEVARHNSVGEKSKKESLKSSNDLQQRHKERTVVPSTLGVPKSTAGDTVTAFRQEGQVPSSPESSDSERRSTLANTKEPDTCFHMEHSKAVPSDGRGTMLMAAM